MIGAPKIRPKPAYASSSRSWSRSTSTLCSKSALVTLLAAAPSSARASAPSTKAPNEPDVGVRASAHHAAIAQAVQACRRAGQKMDRFLEREQTTLAHRLLQEARRVAERRDHVEVRARVGRADHSARIAPDLEARLPIGLTRCWERTRERGAQLVVEHDRHE